MGLGLRAGTLVPRTQSPAPPRLPERVRQEDAAATPLRTHSHSTPHTRLQPARPRSRTHPLGGPSTPPRPLPALFSAFSPGERGKGTGAAGCAGSRMGGLPAGVGTAAAGSGFPHPRKECHPQGKRGRAAGLEVEAEPGTRADPEPARGLQGGSTRERTCLPNVGGHTRLTLSLGWDPQCSQKRQRS